MTRQEILNTPEIVDFMIDKSVMVDSKIKLHKRLEELCKLTIKALEQQSKTVHWIDIQYFKADDTYYRPKCPFCSIEPKEYSNYCPNCGADMRESEE